MSSVKGMILTLMSTVGGMRQSVTRQYPNVPTPVQDRFMGFPALTWDEKVEEPYCTACMVCIRNCPTQCMSATMKDNPKNAEGESHRKKIVDHFEINLNRCILCGICVEVCNFDAIVMSHEHEKSVYQRNGDRVDLPALLQMGWEFQEQTEWVPPSVKAKAKAAEKAKAEKQKGEEAPADGSGDAGTEEPKEDETPAKQ